MSTAEVKSRRAAGLKTPTNLGTDATRDISGALNLLLADLFALYLKTKNFHWHVSGPHFRDYHLLLDEQAEDIFKTTDELAERVRKIGGVTCSVSCWPRTKGSSRPCARPTRSPRTMRTWPPPACWKCSST